MKKKMNILYKAKGIQIIYSQKGNHHVGMKSEYKKARNWKPDGRVKQTQLEMSQAGHFLSHKPLAPTAPNNFLLIGSDWESSKSLFHVSKQNEHVSCELRPRHTEWTEIPTSLPSCWLRFCCCVVSTTLELVYGLKSPQGRIFFFQKSHSVQVE